MILFKVSISKTFLAKLSNYYGIEVFKRSKQIPIDLLSPIVSANYKVAHTSSISSTVRGRSSSFIDNKQDIYLLSYSL